MKRRRNDFAKPQSSEPYYDLEYDRKLIEASLAQQYGIRIRYEPDITYAEWESFMVGLLPDSPLGKVVSIRSEKDRERIRAFTKDERRIYDEWQTFRAKHISDAEAEKMSKSVEQMIKNMFGGG